VENKAASVNTKSSVAMRDAPVTSPVFKIRGGKRKLSLYHHLVKPTGIDVPRGALLMPIGYTCSMIRLELAERLAHVGVPYILVTGDIISPKK
jgi:hypothetical protein